MVVTRELRTRMARSQSGRILLLTRWFEGPCGRMPPRAAARMGRRVLAVLMTVALVGGAAEAVGQPTPVQNLAAFHASAVRTNASYHWDATSGGQPQVATTQRFPLPATPLTTVSWDPLRPEFFQEKTIDAVAVQCTLVATFTGPYATWTAPAGTVTELTFTTGGTTNFIMPFVTWGETLRDYLQSTYFPLGGGPPAPADVQLRMQQALGLAPTTTTSHGLALFWVPLTNLARPAYSGDIATQLPASLPTFPDGSFQTVVGSGPAGFSYLDVNDSTTRYATLTDYVTWNQAQTTYPWTAMGYTFNWNALQTGTDPAYGFDPLAPSSFGVSEFIVSAGSKIVNERFVTGADLAAWVAVPEPLLAGPAILVITVVLSRRRASGAAGQRRRGRGSPAAR